jgi:hypothetical protein
MRSAVLLVALALASGAFPAATHATESPKPKPPLQVPLRLAQALVRQGYPAHRACGSILEPPPPLNGSSGSIRVVGRSVPACWLVIYKHRYSIIITPHSSRAAARLAYQRTQNAFAIRTHRIAIGRLLVSAYRVPDAAWRVIRRITSTVAG